MSRPSPAATTSAPSRSLELPTVVRWGFVVMCALGPLAAGPLLAAALHPWAGPARTTASLVLWVGWAVLLASSLVRDPRTLVLARVAGPGALAVTLASAVTVARRGPSPVLTGTADLAHVDLLLALIALGWAIVVAVTSLSAPLGFSFINGPAYPNETRHMLRIPGPLWLGPVQLCWLVIVATVCCGPVLVAAGRPLVGAAVLLIGGAASVIAYRALLGLARRWLVFVPAGLVLHDGTALKDPVLFERRTIQSLRPAPADTGSLDLTQGAYGLALELVLREKVAMSRMLPGGRAHEEGRSAMLLCTPTRAADVLAEARTRGLPVG